MTNKKTLCIIGNGFDLHHWNGTQPNTKYEYFAKFLERNEPEIYELFCNFFPLNGNWKNFEETLSELDTNHLWEEKIRDYCDDSSGERMGEASWEAQKYVNLLTTDMRKALHTFIHGDAYDSGGIKYPKNINAAKIQLPPNALYLSFNYTNTLERYYSIPASEICYIHEKSGNGNDLVIGHGVDPADLKKSEPLPIMPDNLSQEEQEMWEDQMNDQYSFSANLAEDEIGQYWRTSFKDTQSIIKACDDFFITCRSVDHVIVMGHSISEVDEPYFEEIEQRIHPNAFWEVAFYDEDEKERLKSTLTCLGILENKMKFFQLKDRIIQ